MSDAENPHYFLCEELMVPNADKNDGGRINMLTSQLPQFLTLDNAETPKVFSGFENQIGKYTSAVKKYNEPIQILKIFALNENNFFIVVELLESNKYDLINYSSSINLTESYGYTSEFMVDITEGVIIPKDTVIYKNKMYDENLNLQIGVNLKCVYLAKEGLTYEDGVPISESAAKKLSHTEVTEIVVILNSNDILINKYGTSTEYKPYPNIGESIENGILCARRRINYNFVLDEFKNSNFSEVNSNDQCFYIEGIVEDITIYSNLTDEEKAYKFNAHLVNNVDGAFKIYNSIFKYLQKLKDSNTNQFCDDLNWLLQYSIDYINPTKKYSFDNTEFNGAIIKFKIKNTVKAKVGSKITGRFSNKGVVSKIIPDDEMPMTEDGLFRAEVCLNGLGVVGRLNIGQNYEMELSHYADFVINKFKNNRDKLFTNIMKFLSISSPKQHEFLVEKLKNKQLKKEYIDLVLADGLYIHQPPFFENANEDTMIELIKTFDIKLSKFVGIHEDLVAGTMYMIKLKHEPYGKLSIRSAGPISLLNVPYKNNESYKKGNSLYSNAAIRFGEMETINMMLTKDSEMVGKFIRTYSSSEQSRQFMVSTLMNTPIDKIDTLVDPDDVSRSNTAETLKALFAGTGIDLQTDFE